MTTPLFTASHVRDAFADVARQVRVILVIAGGIFVSWLGIALIFATAGLCILALVIIALFVTGNL